MFKLRPLGTNLAIDNKFDRDQKKELLAKLFKDYWEDFSYFLVLVQAYMKGKMAGI